MAEAGAVTEAAATATGWRGAVAGGRRPFRVHVVFRSSLELEARCSCPQNQSSGECCAHAVAVGLALLKPSTRELQAPVKAPVPEIAWEVCFASSWRKSIARAQLPLLVGPSARRPGDADRSISEWFRRQGGIPDRPLRLNLTGSALEEWLGWLGGMTGLREENGGGPIELSDGQRLQVEDGCPESGVLQLKPIKGPDPWIRLGGSTWCISEAGLRRAGRGDLPSSLRPHWETLGKGETCCVDLRVLLGDLGFWQDWIEFPEGGWLQSLHFVPAEVRFRLSLDGSAERVSARLQVAYDEEPWLGCLKGDFAHLPRWSGDRCELRNTRAEEMAMAQLGSMGFCVTDPGSDSLELSGREAIRHWVADELLKLRDQWEVVESQSFRSFIQSLQILRPEIQILGQAGDDASFDIKFKTNDGNILSLQQVRSLLGASSGQRGSSSWVLPSVYSRVVEPLLADLDVDQRAGRFVCSSKVAEVICEISKKFHKSNNLSNQELLNIVDLPATFQAELRPYQLQGFAWLWDRVRRYQGALLADDMGLGKTVQTIALIERLMMEDQDDSGVVLVVVTASLLGNWKAEWQRFAPSRRVHGMHGVQRDALRDVVRRGDVVLTTYGTLTRDLAWHLSRRYRAVVADEASLMRNPDTDHAKAVAKLDTASRIALTGTPLENSVRDLWSVFRFVQPGWLGARKAFEERYGADAEGHASDALERLRLKISPFVLRRTKWEVAPELPAKWQIDEYCDLSEEQQAIYRQLLDESRRQVERLEQVKQDGAARMKVLTALLRLRQVCNDLALLDRERFAGWSPAARSGKMSRLIELLEEGLDGGHKILVFSQFQKQLLEIEAVVRGRGWDCLRLDGQSGDRQRLVDRFQSPDGPPIFLISLKAGGYGLNLTAADTVIHFDPWWNPAAEAQATDRAHRIGQLRPVTVYRLLTRGTVEERVVGLQERKRGLAAMVDESGETDGSGMSQQELESLLRDA